MHSFPVQACQVLSRHIPLARGCGGFGSLQSLTVRERILLHLFDHVRASDSHEAPEEVTQSGIARAAGIRAQHVPQYVRPLIADGAVEERTGHIRRGARRRKVYCLTSGGRQGAVTLRNALLQEQVPFRPQTGEVEYVPMLRLLQDDRRGTTLLALLQELRSHGSVAEAMEVPTAGGVVDFTREAPRVERFYGREADLRQVLAGLDRRPLTVVTGMAGMGKTTLSAKACSVLRGKRSLFWRQTRPWDTSTDLALRLAAFLHALARPGLHAYLAGPDPKDLGRIEELLLADLSDLDAVLVFDDVHQASPDAEAFLAVLFRALRARPGVRALFTSRTPPSFYSRREVEVDGSVAEVALHGLDHESAGTLLTDVGVPTARVGGFVRACGGSPLFLQLVASVGGVGKRPEEAWKTLETYIAEQVEPALDEGERECLELASFYRVPVGSEGLLMESPVRRKTLASLEGRGLLKRVEADRYVVHETLGAYFQRGISAERRAALAAKAVPWLSSQAEAAAKAGHPEDAIPYLSNAVFVDDDGSRRRDHSERLGDLRRLVGDQQAAIEAYRSALGLAEDPEARAHFHQKIAGLHVSQGRLEEAQKEVEGGLGLLPAKPSPAGGWLLFQRARLVYSREEYEKALEILETVAGWLPALPQDSALWASVANLRGLVHVSDPNRRDPALALADFRSAAEAFQAAGDLRGLCMAYNNLGYAAQELGLVDSAVEYLERAATIAAQVGDIPARMTALFTKAYCLVECMGQYEAAETFYLECYKMAKLAQLQHKVIWHYWHFANLYRRQGRYEEARESLAYFLERSGDMLNDESRAEEHAAMARLCVLSGDLDEAKRHLARAEEFARASPTDYANHKLDWARGSVLAASGDSAGAINSFQRALGLAGAEPDGEFLLEYGLFLERAREPDRAKPILEEACGLLARHGLRPLEHDAREALGRVTSEAWRPTST